MTFEEKYKHLPSLPRIVCAAISVFKPLGDASQGAILVGARHWDNLMRDQFKLLQFSPNKDFEDQGFIDQFGNFYDRKEAKVIAEYNNQVIRIVGGDSENLYSENLY